ncbi:uncharacterized protein LOC106719016 [Papilio machaon]|uniref:uncharacterized protein LOC106719016 n=1 Tax=Papilio machaon TaxID=76193 RepID=UPI001E6651E6|nr:uncharacterized protein LOC106719016 [Papilio machaon]
MAGNKINTKYKGKEDKSKVAKGTIQTSEEADDLDYTLLRKPILTSVTGLAQAIKIFDFATEELKSLLSTECDLIYECKVCRNLFRSLVNFISHKRMYCKDKFNSSMHSHFVNPTCMNNEINKIKQLEDEYQESLKVTSNLESVETDETDDRIPLTKDLTAIVEKIGISKGVKENPNEDQELFLQSIPKTSVAVYQNFNVNNETNCDIRTQVNELDNILSQNKAVLQHDGKVIIQNCIETNTTNGEHENIIQISDDDENEETNSLKCRICDLQFSTLKTLKFHMKYKHLESRLVYPCPDCLEIFSTSWSVYRHLFKVHRKTAAQIRRLRESIQAKAFRMNNPPAFYEKKKRENKNKPSTPPKITEEERLEQENQAWMDNMEGDGEIPRCGGCGRTFERRAALAAHTHTCQPRCRALARRADTKKIEIQIRKDYNKGPSGIALPVKTTDNNDNKLNKEEIKTTPKPSSESLKLEEVTHESATIMRNEPTETPVPPDAKLFTERRINITINNSHNFRPKLPHAQQIEKNNLAALRLRLQPDTDLEKLLCKKCDTRHSQILELYEHMAGHYKWMRYACKLCNFKNYGFGNLLEHVKIVHKLKGDSDFYYSTVKAIDANQAIELAEPVEQIVDTNEASPDSRRTSRCSSDSSRLSDESSSSSVRIEGAKKRKMNSGRSIPKKKKEINDESMDKRSNSALSEKETVPEIEYVNTKIFEENSSDIDEIDEKIPKKKIIGEKSSMASRRPIRKRTRPKNEDFEYDLSNLLKLEAQGYRDSQIIATKPPQNKRKSQIDIQNNYETVNRDCCGALLALSKKSIENAAAHMKVLSFTMNNIQKEQRPSNVFVRPMIPKVAKADKTSPKKDSLESTKEVIIVNKITPEIKTSTTATPVKEVQEKKETNEKLETIVITSPEPTSDEATVISNDDKNIKDNESCKEVPAIGNETVKTNSNIPVVPLKLRRQSVDIIKNPILSKNYTDFSKVGMKTKILVIKPINRNKDGTQTIKAPLKFQTIKLKDPNKGNSSNEEKSKDQVVVVQVPKVDCAVTLPSIVLPNTPNTNIMDNTNIKVEEIVDDKKNEKDADQEMVE